MAGAGDALPSPLLPDAHACSPPLLQARAASSLKVMAYKVTLKTPSGEQVIECADDTYILDAAEEAGERRGILRASIHTAAHKLLLCPGGALAMQQTGSSNVACQAATVGSKNSGLPPPILNRHRPALQLPRGRLLQLRRQGGEWHRRPERPVLPGRRPDGQGLCAVSHCGALLGRQLQAGVCERAAPGVRR